MSICETGGGRYFDFDRNFVSLTFSFSRESAIIATPVDNISAALVVVKK